MGGQPQLDRARLLGLNVEASLVVRLKDTSPLFVAATNYLAHMKAIAEPEGPAVPHVAAGRAG